MHRTLDLVADDLAFRQAGEPMGAAVLRAVEGSLDIVESEVALLAFDKLEAAGLEIRDRAYENPVPG
jgi:hypothetical protein